MNENELIDFDSMSHNFERDIVRAKEILGRKGAYDFETVDTLQRLAQLMQQYSVTYVDRRRK